MIIDKQLLDALTAMAQTLPWLWRNIDLQYSPFDGSQRMLNVLEPGGDCVGLNIPLGQWHSVEVLESGTVIWECKDGGV